MANDMMADMKAFHEKFGLAYEGYARQLPDELLEFRQRFMDEELTEYKDDAAILSDLLKSGVIDDANTTYLLEKQLDALVDLVYVALGTAYLHGFDFDEAWRRVHEANMKKVRAERAADSKRGSTFDVVKPAGWQPPSHADLVENHAHRETPL